ncbi:MAG TPA: aspartate--tRNA ligase [Candidatus Scybalousia intestinigallinarum]|nr:aspartate--tRNA ligase [Candidatus Scybalousia intestinigallinarum]
MKKYENASFNLTNVGEEVELEGWIQKKRNLGGLIFIDLRDRSGIIQLVIRPENDIYELASNLKSEYVIWAKGKIVERESKNDKIPTGEIEVEVSELNIINTAKEIPFEISDDTSALEDTRLKYRYLDLRRPSLQHNLMIRSKVTLIARNFLSKLGFVEVETPILCKSTPEGARDYLVPSRISKGCFYALPQSPQIYKQLLMIGGMEKYFQIARCFRDEDLRADRQPEFTQIDIEMSFAEEEDIWQVTEGLMREIFKEIKGVELEKFPRLTYNECIDRFGSDKPDTRFKMELQDITDIFNHTEFQIFKDVIEKNGVIRAIVAKNTASKYSRKDIDKLTEFVKIYQAKALAFLKYKDQEWSGSIAKVLSGEEKESLKTRLEIEEDDTIFIIADTRSIASTALGALRLKLGHELELIDHEKYNFLWVTDFPMFEYSEEEGRYVAAHHPFTSPNKEDIDKLLTDKENCYSRAYDLVLNGYELLSGSVRIHEEELQEKVFEAIGMTHEEAERKFGFFLDAFQYGAPPHCGVGIGLERLIMILVDTDNIRDVVAFPKTASATCLMSEAPNEVDKKQLDELGIEVKKRVKEDL